MQTIFNLSQAEVENLLKDHETEEVSIQVQMSKSENLPSTVTEEPSQFDSQFGESQLGDTSGRFFYNQNILFKFFVHCGRQRVSTYMKTQKRNSVGANSIRNDTFNTN